MEDLTQLTQDLQSLQLVTKSALNTKSQQTEYCTELAFQENEPEPTIAVVTSDFSIRLVSLQSQNLLSTSVIKGHKKHVRSVKFTKSSPHLLYSCSEDGTLRCWDTRTDSPKEVQQFQKPKALKVGLLSMDLSHSDRVLCAGSEKDENDACVLFWDTRQENCMGCYSECHGNDITQIQFQPKSDQFFAAASSDGLVCTYDIAQSCEDDAIQLTLNAEADVDKVGWSGEGSKSCVYCVTTDNQFYLWDFTQGECILNIPGVESLKPSGSNHVTEYVLDCIPDMTGNGDASCVLLGGSHSGALSLVSYRSGDAHVVTTLTGGHTETVRCSLWDSQSRMLFTGGEDGQVCVWKPDVVSVSLQASTSSNEAKVKKVIGEERKEGRRDAKPYKKPIKPK